MSYIRINNLVKKWGEHTAVDNISFEVKKGQFIALLGPSGCGKSTTLRLLAGLENATSGEIYIEDRNITRCPAAQRNLSMVFQSYALFPHLSVAENITFGLSIRGVNKKEQKIRLEETISLLGLSQLLHRKPSELSGGQQQRVALGRALIANRPICLLDEPLSNLDAQLRAEMRHEIRALQQKLGITMIFVTHDQTEAMSMADSIILMNKGKIEQIGPPIEFYNQPATIFSAKFIGVPPMNILDVVNSNGDIYLDNTLLVKSYPSEFSLSLGIRPEHINITENGIRAQVINSEYFGADTITTCKIGHQLFQIRTQGSDMPENYSFIHLSFDKSHLHLFESISGTKQIFNRAV